MKKGGASLFMKNIISQLSSLAKSKSLAIKRKVESIKARVIICSLSKNKKLPLSISHKIHALLLGGTASLEDNNHKVFEPTNNVDNLQLVLHKADSLGDWYHEDYAADEEEDNKYPDLRHSLFDQEDDLDLGNDPNASVIDLVKNSMADDGEDFSLEDEIDHVADLFIMKFHKRMRLQKLESFKRYQDMLERSS
ncbi:hypothetical protein HanXRQr2_Chr04g0192661 [Helianthus annuus]|uniref:Uncharacterized protein n=1 Tax=Helianthus annuus TaxID=4232 RepID=A0A251TRJ2_HELAN|nr:uncharacterized protein LOC110887023 [Helianthus annuus]KAF5812443.1 hypothetical protein HanXRQr2_Chr04g0192661 [Helianthus annuus]KAJ0591382.1 hypothetical protein HanIR_Chr04g0207751 [Helianthus annuus]KAJ0598985.1 hypothetical protein HanHA89_Chr04g0171731 [Helianthus annuus]